ncbi:hypothetical protein AVDCRST_MAG84-2372 [uncultured Microcoleus sp.]|uniref:Uncharacterized protein n=1 Tax=uncultured Microcoleus sp. TaxID=259945 RepID=A0A6J4LTE7_9CYAN|nr:hypothetical protein AVDCRST_MAG84-2372 [uncultured Microcoleus sp.]
MEILSKVRDHIFWTDVATWFLNPTCLLIGTYAEPYIC